MADAATGTPGSPAGDHRAIAIAAGLVLALGCLLRFVYLDADPVYYAWVGYPTDEGRWVEKAREFSLWGAFDADHLYHLVLAPGYQLVAFGLFEAFGISHTTARILPAVSGCVLLLLFAWITRRRVGATAAFAGIAFLTLHPDMLWLSRIAIPEMPAMAASLLVFAILVSDLPRTRRCLLAGIASGGMLAFKGTTLPLVLIFAVILFAEPRSGSAARVRSRLADVGWFLLPLVGTGTVAASGLALLRPAEFTLLVQIGGFIADFAQPRTLYGMVSLPFVHDHSAPLAFGLLFAWPGVLCLLVDDEQDAPRRVAMLRGSAIWAGLYLLEMTLLAYFPERYMAHITVPVALLGTAGIDWLIRGGRTALAVSIRQWHSANARRWTLLAVAVLPTGVFFATPIAGAIVVVAGDENRFLIRLSSVALTTALGAIATLRWRDRAATTPLLLALPAWSGLIWVASWVGMVPGHHFWPTSAGELGITLARLALAVVASAAIVVGSRYRPLPARALALAATLATLVVFASDFVPFLRQPRYEIRDLSRSLGERFGDEPLVGHSRADGMFLDNSLRYGPLGDVDGLPRFAIAVYDVGWLDDRLERYYEPIESFDLHLSPRFVEQYGRHYPADHLTPEGHHVTLYRLKDVSKRPSVEPRSGEPLAPLDRRESDSTLPAADQRPDPGE